ncbi:MAG: LssY C-terminal domain-containing protein [Planctomycetota bacterium]
MSDAAMNSASNPSAGGKRNTYRRVAKLVFLILIVYFVAAYLMTPFAWKTYERHHPAIDDAPRITHTGSGIPGDPLNVGVVATEAQLKAVMIQAGWGPADALSFKSCIEIADATVLRRPYADAPVSNLYLWGRKQDLAFEKPIGHDPRKRNHVRFWRSEKLDEDGRPLWIGSATLDVRVGFSHTTGQITHHISPDVDAERDLLLKDIQGTGDIANVYWIDDFQTVRKGHNGGGDPYYTDGRLGIAVVRILFVPTSPKN